jgi:hypothetical protein
MEKKLIKLLEEFKKECKTNLKDYIENKKLYDFNLLDFYKWLIKNNMKNKNPKCVLCGKECENKWGNNPQPLKSGKCCNKCNSTKVIPARIKMFYKRTK